MIKLSDKQLKECLVLLESEKLKDHDVCMCGRIVINHPELTGSIVIRVYCNNRYRCPKDKQWYVDSDVKIYDRNVIDLEHPNETMLSYNPNIRNDLPILLDYIEERQARELREKTIEIINLIY